MARNLIYSKCSICLSPVCVDFYDWKLQPGLYRFFDDFKLH